MRTTILFLLSTITLFAQLQTGWKRVSSGDAKPPEVGKGYLTVSFLAGGIQEKSTWWTDFVAKGSKRGTAVFSTSAKVGQVSMEATSSTLPLEFKQGNSLYRIPYTRTLVSDLALNFSEFGFTVSLVRSADDKLDSVVEAFTKIAQTTPALGISSQTTAIVPAAKTLLDFVFQKDLKAQRGMGGMKFAAGTSPPPGIYYNIACDNQRAVDNYLADSSKVTWKDDDLHFDNQPLRDASYFVISIAYKEFVYPDPVGQALSIPTQWSGAMNVLKTRAGLTRAVKDEQASQEMEVISGMFAEAVRMLHTDMTLTASEKDNIVAKVRDHITTAFHEQRKRLGGGGNLKKAVLAPMD